MSDTIAAISTPPGEGGIGIVRVSGERALEIMKKVYPGCPGTPAARHAYYGEIRGRSGEIIDEAIIIFMKGPHTYTCEDILEIQAHGGPVSMKLILRAVIEAGARPAQPGEFTKLAFLNGRLDLTQAEAVIDLIRSRSSLPHEIAARQLEGRLGSQIRDIRGKLTDILAQMAVNIDFPDEDIEQVAYDSFISDLAGIASLLEPLISSEDTGKIAREGIKAAIIGRPNVGKSSLLNEILGEGRAIVTDVPGTTRDTIEETAQLAGVPVVLIDTAGIRDAADEIEKIGIERSKKEIEAADLVILVLDGSESISDEDLAIMETVSDRKLLAVINKQDLGTVVQEKEIKKMIPGAHTVTVSLKNKGAGLAVITSEIEKMLLGGEVSAHEDNIVTNERQLAALNSAEESLSAAISLLEKGEPLEIAELEAHSACDSLGEIIGETAGEEILDAVFSKFCLGK